MIKYLVLIVSLFISCNSENIEPTGLMVEFIREPDQSLILDAKPEFSWVVPHEVKLQSSYQLQIASTLSLLKEDKADIWDSKKIINSNSTEISYKGNNLSEFSNYFWRVKIWNSKDIASSYSKIQAFKTGKFKNYATTNNKFTTQLIQPKSIIQTNNNHYFIDFGKDAFGTLILQNIHIKSSDTITIHLGEKATNNKVDREPGGSIRYESLKLKLDPKISEYEIKLPKNKRNTSGAAIKLPDSLGVVMPFRYCEIENYPEELHVNNIKQKSLNYYFEDDTSYFKSSDSILNQVWELCKYTMKATSFAGLYVDGDRERIPYEADAYINQLGHYYTDREYSMARLTNEYFMEHPTWPTEWILHTVPMFYKDLMYTGNSESVKNNYNKLKQKTLLSLSRTDGLISSKQVTSDLMQKLGFSDPNARIKDIVDWPPGQKNTGWKLATSAGERDGYEMVEINTVVNAFHYQNLIQMSFIAGILNKKEDSVFFHKRAILVKSSINNKLFDATKGIYIDGENSKHSSLHANMFPLAFDLIPDNKKEKVIQFIKSRGMACSVYGAQYLMEGLYKAGEGDYAKSLLTSINDRSWWNMIKSGSTISMEAWDIKYKPNTDWNHAWGAAPANIIPMGLWGIYPTDPAYKNAIIKPQLADLKFSEIEVPTIKGSIIASYKKEEESRNFIIILPGNMKCKFIFPMDEKSIVKFNGERMVNYKGFLNLLPGSNTINMER